MPQPQPLAACGFSTLNEAPPSDSISGVMAVMAAAHRHGIRTAALTDHDTTSGWAEAADAAVSLGMSFLPGMELSARHEWRSVHVLAYLVDPDDAGLVAAQAQLVVGDAVDHRVTHGGAAQRRGDPTGDESQVAQALD